MLFLENRVSYVMEVYRLYMVTFNFLVILKDFI